MVLTIPKIIHQTWKCAQIPRRLYAARWIESWKKHHPEWEYRLWTDEDNHLLLSKHYPSFLPLYSGYSRNIMRADAARYFILHRYGGVYVDLDFICLRSIEPLIADSRLVFGKMLSELSHPDSVPNAFMASVPGHTFWEEMFHELEIRFNSEPMPENVTGSRVLQKVLVEQIQLVGDCLGLKLLNPETLYGINWHQESYLKGNYVPRTAKALRRKHPEAYALTFWTHRWGQRCNWPEWLKNYWKSWLSGIKNRDLFY